MEWARGRCVHSEGYDLPPSPSPAPIDGRTGTVWAIRKANDYTRLGGLAGFIGLYAFPIFNKEARDGELDGTLHIQTRMFDATLEDPPTGSAASTLAGWLTQREGKGE